MYKDKQILGCISDSKYASYDNTGTGLSATNAQDAITELNGKLRNECLTYNKEFDYFGFIYNGEWKNILYAGLQRKFLYNKGDECAVLSGGWGTYTSGGTVTKNDNCMVIYVGNNSSYRANAYTNNYIDLTNYNKLIITADTLVTGYKAIQLINPSGTITELKSVYGNASYSKDNPIELNISNYNGEYRIQFYAAAYNGADKFTIYSVELV